MIDLTACKNILFDLGGVLLNIQPQRTIDAFEQMGLSGMILSNGHNYAHDIFLKMERGLVSDDEFRDGIRQLLGKPLTDAEIDAAWSAMILDFPKERLDMLKTLSKHYRIFLFSNTNAIHVKCFEQKFREAYQFELASVFEKRFYSNELKLRKPAPESFLKVCELADILPEETMFIDDSKPNIESAATLGFRTCWLEPGQKTEELLAAYL